MEDFTKDILICDCSSEEHQLLVRYFNNDTVPEVYVSMHLAKRSFWERVMYAIDYVFGHQSRYGSFEEVILGPQHINSLQSVIDHIRKVEAKKAQLELFKNENSNNENSNNI